MMLPLNLVPFLAAWGDVLWHFLGAILVLVSLILIFIILIQDSKGAGLTSAFGAGPGGESLLGARMQRDVARYTSILAVIFAALVIAMGLLGNCRSRYGSAGAAGARTGSAVDQAKKDEASPGPGIAEEPQAKTAPQPADSPPGGTPPQKK